MLFPADGLLPGIGALLADGRLQRQEQAKGERKEDFYAGVQLRRGRGKEEAEGGRAEERRAADRCAADTTFLLTLLLTRFREWVRKPCAQTGRSLNE